MEGGQLATRTSGGGETMPEKQKTARPRGTDSAKVIQVIETATLEGNGTETDPCRLQKQYWSLDGELLAVGIDRN